jgi:hypothetical protein
MVPFILIIPYSYLLGHHSHSSMTKNRQKWLKTYFLQLLPLKLPNLPTTIFYGLNFGNQLSNNVTKGA